MQKKQICILGATGSIGRQTLDVIKQKQEHYNVVCLTTNNNIELLEKQCAEFSPRTVVIVDEIAFNNFKRNTNFSGNILYGSRELEAVAADNGNDLIISALVGFAGVLPTLAAIKAGKNVALANKEALVSAGKIITNAANLYNVKILPIDSEHNAVLQCLAGEKVNNVEKLILTASGGPFWVLDKNEFKNITPKQALAHPKWAMGNKVTIDSATMMNKGFEVIEAHWLFGISANKISVLVHPQSIVHSLVQFVDSSVKAQLACPDMRLPISYALSYPERYNYDFPTLDLDKIGHLDFFKPDFEKFPCLEIAYKALENGGNSAIIVNAANEIAVEAFIGNKIRFNEISTMIEQALLKFEKQNEPNLEEVIYLDSEVRNFLSTFIH